MFYPAAQAHGTRMENIYINFYVDVHHARFIALYLLMIQLKFSYLDKPIGQKLNANSVP